MDKIICGIFFIIITICPLSAQNTFQDNIDFSLNLYKELAKKEGNIFFSPYGVSSVLSMAYSGAKGDTAKELGEALCFKTSQENVPAEFKKLNAQLLFNARNWNNKLDIANALCLTGGTVDKSFSNLLQDNYEAKIFTGGVNEINDWCKLKTNGKIPRIIDTLSSNSVCVLLNAVYFKGTWEKIFDKIETVNAPFKISSDIETSVPLMNKKSMFKILNKKDFQAVSIPYKGNVLSMIVILPRDINGLKKFEKQLTAASLKNILVESDNRKLEDTQLHLPRFKFETEYDLVQPCQSLGIKKAFSENFADFSGISGSAKNNLLITQLMQKTFLDVNEEGTEAIAVTTWAVGAYSIPTSIFRADHPFIFLIRDNQTNTILFMGRLADPSENKVLKNALP